MTRNAIRPPPWAFDAFRALSAAAREAAAALVEGVPSAKGGVMSEWNSLPRRLSALKGAPEGSVAAVLDKWLRDGGKVTVPRLMKRVRELRRHRRHRDALEVMNWMEIQAMELPSSCNTIKLALISKVKGIDTAEEYFSMLPDHAKEDRTYITLFSCYCSVKMTEKAVALFKRMKDLGVGIKTLVYNSLMSLYMKLGQFKEVPIIFEEMKACDIIPDDCTVKILTRSYAVIGDIISVDRVAQEFEESHGALDWSTYCHLASIYNSVELFEKAHFCLKKAELVTPSKELSAIPVFINLYARAGKLGDVKRMWKHLKAKVIRPTNANYFVMLQALKKLDDIEAVKQCFAEWETACLNYDLRLLNVVMDAFLQKGMVEEVKLLQEKAVEKTGQCGLSSFALLSDYHLRIGETELSTKYSKMAISTLKQGWIEAPVTKSN